jgi:hypothetical protein
MNTDVMIDMETLATGTNPVMLTIGACKFDPLGDELNKPEMEVLYLRLEIEDQISLGREVNDSTIEWWGRQTADAQQEALGNGTSDNPRYSAEEAFDKLYKFCWGAKRVWSNGAGADIVWCETMFPKIQRAIPWKFWEVRDVRTAFDLGINPNMPPVTAHNALEDAINQAIGIQNVYRQLSQYVEPFKDWKKRG